MIFFSRSRIGPDDRPIEPSKAWLDEAEAKRAEMLRSGKPEEFDEPFYRRVTLKTALEELTHRKCAYCESPLPEYGFDVEHFRPKGKIDGVDSHPGYYWLAYEWANLYPSCAGCNRRLIDYPTFGEDSTSPAAGKSFQFPIADETKRAFRPEDALEDEEPLLLDPCSENPEKHFRYNPLGEVQPSEDSLKARTSIEVFNLNRKRLRDNRQKRLRELISALNSDGDTSPFVQDSAYYAGACRYVLADPDTFAL